MRERMFKAGFLYLMIAALFVSCGEPKQQQQAGEIKTFEPSNADGFVTEIQTQFENVRENLASSPVTYNRRYAPVREVLKDAHLKLSHDYPIYYDWWLQDGDEVNWFEQDRTLACQLSRRLLSVHLDLMDEHERQMADMYFPVEETPEGIKAAFEEYFAACEKRRTERLAGFVKDNPTIVFTKFEPFRPSFFAYTEAVSDNKGEFNFIPGTELAQITMNGIWGEEEVLIRDTAGVIRDPNMHFDGRHVVFSWKQSERQDDYHLYEIDLDTRKITQITDGLGRADIEGIYLPDGNILFNSTRCGTAVDCANPDVSNMFICARDGQFVRQVGFDQVHTVWPSLLDDGRVVYTRWDYNDRAQMWTQPLFQMNADGTGQAEYYGVNSWFPTTATHVRQIPGTRKVMATMTGHHSPQHGKLGIIDPEAGRDENEGVVLVAPVRVPDAERIDGYGQFGDQFQYPFPLNEKEFLISYSALGYNVGRPMYFGIFWMNVDGDRELLVSDPNNSCNVPLLAAERPVPFNRVSTVDYTKDYGTYYIQNIYEGNSMEGVEPGAVKQLRVVEIDFRVAQVGAAFGFGEGGSGHAGTPVGVGNASWDVKVIHGTVDVHEDGSALFKAPARKPLYFQALDENGFVIQTMRSWSTLQPGEFQSCVGCHEHKNTVPVSNHPVSMAMSADIQELAPRDDKGIRGFSYIKEVQPIWDKNCISCHDGVKHPFSLKGDLKVVDEQTKRRFSESYLNLTHAYQMDKNNESWQGVADHPEVNWISALSEPTILPPYFAGSATSNLITRMREGHGGVQPAENEVQTVALWLDMLVPFVGDYYEANAWTPDELKFYTYHDRKRDEMRAEEQANVHAYIKSLAKAGAH